MLTGKPPWWDEAVSFLKKDALLGPIVEKYCDGCLEGQGDLFSTLVRSIVGQQISVLAADAIWARLVEKVEKVIPENILKLNKLGNSSVHYEIGLFSNFEEKTAARISFIHVFVDVKTRKPKKIPSKLLEPLKSLMKD